MTDYIKREDAYSACCYETPECYTARKDIKALPSSDVAPVRHGRWVKHGTRDRMTCSCCGDYWEMGSEWTADNFKGWFKFCPKCGARMDGDEQ